MDDERTLFLCMGSACHRLGVYEILPRLQAALTSNGFHGVIKLKGHFCLENCSQGVVARYQDQRFEHILPHNVTSIFEREILPCLQASLEGTTPDV
ncbi:MAG TPA: (2Fe-2S) ferredoxin domain-containing protein [Capsulimonadaceae bacterium]